MTSTPTTPARIDIDPQALFADPYPIFARLRREAPVAFVSALGRHVVTRYDDVVRVARDWQTFTAYEPGAAENAVVGETLMSFDGEEGHLRLRRIMEAPLKPRVIRDHWEPVFRDNTTRMLDALAARGRRADLLRDFATPLFAMNLGAFLGFDEVQPDTVIEWCKGIIDSGGNFMNDPQIWQRGYSARAGVVEAVDAAADRLRGNPDHSMISAMVNADNPLTPEEMYSNIMISIGGGLNEPRDVLLTAVYGLLTNPDQLQAVRDDASLWRKVFEEACRWVSPIGMFIREVTRPVELSGVQLEAGDKIAGMLASANRDEHAFTDPDVFDIRRTGEKQIAFGGGGPHFCIGAWAARSQVGGIALPALFDRFPNLRLDYDEEVTWAGMVFRGPLNMPVHLSG